MPNVFLLNDFSQLDAHSCLPWDPLAAPFTPPSPSSQYLFHLWFHEIPQTGHKTLTDVSLHTPPPHTHIHTRAPPLLLTHPPLSPSWQRQAGEGTAPFLGTKKQLIYVYETSCLGRPSHCVCGSLPV